MCFLLSANHQLQLPRPGGCGAIPDARWSIVCESDCDAPALRGVPAGRPHHQRGSAALRSLLPSEPHFQVSIVHWFHWWKAPARFSHRHTGRAHVLHSGGHCRRAYQRWQRRHFALRWLIFWRLLFLYLKTFTRITVYKLSYGVRKIIFVYFYL